MPRSLPDMVTASRKALSTTMTRLEDAAFTSVAWLKSSICWCVCIVLTSISSALLIALLVVSTIATGFVDWQKLTVLMLVGSLVFCGVISAFLVAARFMLPIKHRLTPVFLVLGASAGATSRTIFAPSDNLDFQHHVADSIIAVYGVMLLAALAIAMRWMAVMIVGHFRKRSFSHPA